MDNTQMTQNDLKVVFETAKTLLELSYKLRDADILHDIGKEITELADKALQVVEGTENVEPDFDKQDCMCKPGECERCDEQRNQCNGHSDYTENDVKMPESDEMACNGHNAMGPGNDDTIRDSPTGNSSPDIDNEINQLLNKVKGQINDGK